MTTLRELHDSVESVIDALGRAHSLTELDACLYRLGRVIDAIPPHLAA
jgi:hypothetical protein